MSMHRQVEKLAKICAPVMVEAPLLVKIRKKRTSTTKRTTWLE